MEVLAHLEQVDRDVVIVHTQRIRVNASEASEFAALLVRLVLTSARAAISAIVIFRGGRGQRAGRTAAKCG